MSPHPITYRAAQRLRWRTLCIKRGFILNLVFSLFTERSHQTYVNNMVIQQNYRLQYSLNPYAILLDLCLEQLFINTTYSKVTRNKYIVLFLRFFLFLHPLMPQSLCSMSKSILRKPCLSEVLLTSTLWFFTVGPLLLSIFSFTKVVCFFPVGHHREKKTYK